MKIILSENRKKKNKIIEKLAELEHEQWMKWAKDILKTENITEERVKRWKEESFKPYKDLTEEQKDMDREWAEKVYNIMTR